MRHGCVASGPDNPQREGNRARDVADVSTATAAQPGPTSSGAGADQAAGMVAPRTDDQLQFLRDLFGRALANHYHYPGDPDAQLPGEPDRVPRTCL